MLIEDSKEREVFFFCFKKVYLYLNSTIFNKYSNTSFPEDNLSSCKKNKWSDFAGNKGQMKEAGAGSGETELAF